MSQRLIEIARINLIAFLLLISGAAVYSQTQLLTGQINKYARVTTVSANSVTIPLASVTDFHANDTAMVMQMKGAIINAATGLPGLPGNFQNIVGNPGSYEIIVIQSVNTGTGVVTFSRNLLKSYNIAGKVQLIKVSSYRNAVVNTELTCASWDSTTVSGGVLAFLVKGKLTLNANINVDSKGLKGGTAAPGSGYCQMSDDTIKWYFYNKFSSASGYKGEGLAIRNNSGISIYPGLAKGKGVSLTGGGGGNGHYSGGGGGSNYGAGNSGYVEVSGCNPFIELSGGNGGYGVSSIGSLSSGVFLGGGGGASTYGATPSTSNGGQGGGIVIILADTIAGNGRVISANGGLPNLNASPNSGAGGGGGAGSAIVSTRYFSSNPVLRANGGQGGNTNNSQGCGGGGGGGLVWTKAAFTGTATVAGGIGGYNMGAPSNLDGFAGSIKTGLNIPLNGFLFNEIYSSVNLTEIDSICQGEVPPALIGTSPAGGSGSYTYQWQRSYDNSTWTNVTGTSMNYTPADAETDTVWFRRVVDDGAGITDRSMPVMIIVHQMISGNLVGRDTTLCNGQNPEELYPLNAGPSGGNKKYSYTWQKSPNGTTGWANADGDFDNFSYDPPSLTASQYYHRIVNSGACTDVSSNVTVTILPSIGNNSVTADQTICQGSAFANLAGSNPSGGASSFSYLWKSSVDNISWAPASGTNSGINYDPQNDTPGSYYFKRIVYSGANNTCQDTSASVQLVSLPSISNNTVAADQTICQGSTFATLDGSSPAGGAGAGTYNYQWQNSIDGSAFGNISGANSEDYPGTTLNSSMWYRRIVTSSVCSNTSGNLKVTVDPSITTFQIGMGASGHDTICTGTEPAQLIGTPSGGLGSYTFKWEYSTDNVTFTDLSTPTQNYQSAALTSTTWFRRTVYSGTCSGQSTFKVTVLPLVSGNTISADQRVCNTVTPALLTGSTPSGGDGKYRYLWERKDASSADWQLAAGTNTTASYQPPILGGNTQFKRNVYSGENNCCTSVSAAIAVTVDTMPQNVTAGPDLTLLPFQFAMNMQGGFDGSGTATWSVVTSDGDPEFEDINDIHSAVTKLGSGDNVFEFIVTNNTCTSPSDEVTITVPEVFIPEGISPNGDNLNDYFRVDGLEYTRNELVIINTSGAVVYRKVNYRSDQVENAWTGLDNNGDELPEGTYYYLLTINGAEDSSIPEYIVHISGFVLIRR